jgi:FKBP-type peptidyl-prolyl cis-trans isomerase
MSLRSRQLCLRVCSSAFRRQVARCVLALAGLVAASAQTSRPVPPQPAGELGTYASMGSGIGVSIGLIEANWTDAQIEAFVAGLRAAHLKQPYPPDDASRRLLTDTQRRAAEIRGRGKSGDTPELRKFLRGARESASMQESESGLLFRILVPGGGPRPRPQDTIVANFVAKMPDGTTEIRDLSGKDLRIRLGDLPPGIVEGIQMLALGAHAVFVLPPWLSFGSSEWPAGIERGTPIFLQVELKDIIPDTAEAIAR